MIEQVHNAEQLADCACSTLFDVRILSLLQAYGCAYPFARFFVQTGANGITAVLSALDRDFTLSLHDGADVEEIAAFLSASGWTALLCPADFLLPAPFTQGVLMQSTATYEVDLQDAQIDRYPKLMDLFNFIDYEAQDFESWYVDLNHRIRHGCAQAVALCKDHTILASGIFSAIYADQAVLTSVQTHPAFRRKGYGSALVSLMTADFGGTVHLMREENRNASFYTRLGFINAGNWRIYK